MCSYPALPWDLCVLTYQEAEQNYVLQKARMLADVASMVTACPSCATTEALPPCLVQRSAKDVPSVKVRRMLEGSYSMHCIQ